MNQDPLRKKKKYPLARKLKQSFQQLFTRNSLPAELPQNIEPDSIDPYLDLCEFEYIYSSMKSVSEASVQKYSEWIKIMKAEPIDQKRLGILLMSGIVDELKALRGVSWRILIGYLPPLRKQWVNILEKNKKSYLELIEEHILSKLRKCRPTGINDHPLNRSKDSYWNNYFADLNLWQIIEKDTRRTRQKEGFFHIENQIRVYEDIELAYLAILSKKRDSTVEYNYDVLTRILFLYAKLNDNQYTQGMNEIVAVIYYCFAQDDCELLKSQAEVDAFFCFCILMSEFKTNFIFVDQNEPCNRFVTDKIRCFAELLKKLDYKMYDQLLKLKIDLKMILVQWFVTSFTKEFVLYDTIRIWDALVCEIEQGGKQAFVDYMSLSILHWMRDDILKGEFGEVLIKLQNLDQQKLDVSRIIETAYMYKKQLKK